MGMYEVCLRFNVFAYFQDILAGCKEALSLSSHSGVILQRLNSSPLQKSCFMGSSSGESGPGLSEEVSASVSSAGSISDINAKHTSLFAARPSRTESEKASFSSWWCRSCKFPHVFVCEKKACCTIFWYVEGRVHVIVLTAWFVCGC